MEEQESFSRQSVLQIIQESNTAITHFGSTTHLHQKAFAAFVLFDLRTD